LGFPLEDNPSVRAGSLYKAVLDWHAPPVVRAVFAARFQKVKGVTRVGCSRLVGNVVVGIAVSVRISRAIVGAASQRVAEGRRRLAVMRAIPIETESPMFTAVSGFDRHRSSKRK